MNSGVDVTTEETKGMERKHHTHRVEPNQCSSRVVQVIEAPLQLVWGLVREFSKPQAYKRFIQSCEIVHGNGEGAGSVREVTIRSGLPAKRSTERLERLDDQMHVMAFTIIGGDHRLFNYKSTVTLHEEKMNKKMKKRHTVVIESFVVDVPTDNTHQDASCFAETIIGCNLRSLSVASLSLLSDTNN